MYQTHCRKPPYASGVGMAKSTRSAFGNRMSSLHQVAPTAVWEKGDDSNFWPSKPAAVAANGEMQHGENSKDIFLQIIY